MAAFWQAVRRSTDTCICTCSAGAFSVRLDAPTTQLHASDAKQTCDVKNGTHLVQRLTSQVELDTGTTDGGAHVAASLDDFSTTGCAQRGVHLHCSLYGQSQKGATCNRICCWQAP